MEKRQDNSTSRAPWQRIPPWIWCLWLIHIITEYKPSAATALFSHNGSADGQFQYPFGIAVLARSQDRILARSQDLGHPTRHLLVVTDDGNHRVQVFNIDGSFVRKWGSKGHGDGQFSRPFGVAVLARSQDRGHPTQDLVYVTDRETQRVQVFDPKGLFITKWGSKGSGPGQFDGLWGVAVHPTRDLIFTAEDNLHRIQAFRGDGTFLFQRGGSHGYAKGEFSYPKHLVIHPMRDLLLVADFGNSRVQVFRLDGSFVCCWTSEGRASSIAVHPTQNVLYALNNNCVHAFSLFSNPKRKRVSSTDDTRVVIRKK